MAKGKRRTKVKYKAPDLFDYQNSSFNPFVPDPETYKRLMDDYDVAAVDHRNRLKKVMEREAARRKLAEQLGVTFVPTLTPTKEILDKLDSLD